MATHAVHRGLVGHLGPGASLAAVLQADAVAAGETTITLRATDAVGLEKEITYVTRARDAVLSASLRRVLLVLEYARRDLETRKRGPKQAR